MVASRNISKGEELHFDYGPNINNSEFFFKYGFMQDPKLSDHVTIKLTLDKENTMWDQQSELLKIDFHNQFFNV